MNLQAARPLSWEEMNLLRFNVYDVTQSEADEDDDEDGEADGGGPNMRKRRKHPAAQDDETAGADLPEQEPGSNILVFGERDSLIDDMVPQEIPVPGVPVQPEVQETAILSSALAPGMPVPAEGEIPLPVLTALPEMAFSEAGIMQPLPDGLTAIVPEGLPQEMAAPFDVTQPGIDMPLAEISVPLMAENPQMVLQQDVMSVPSPVMDTGQEPPVFFAVPENGIVADAVSPSFENAIPVSFENNAAEGMGLAAILNISPAENNFVADNTIPFVPRMDTPVAAAENVQQPIVMEFAAPSAVAPQSAVAEMVQAVTAPVSVQVPVVEMAAPIIPQQTIASEVQKPVAVTQEAVKAETVSVAPEKQAPAEVVHASISTAAPVAQSVEKIVAATVETVQPQKQETVATTPVQKEAPVAIQSVSVEKPAIQVKEAAPDRSATAVVTVAPQIAAEVVPEKAPERMQEKTADIKVDTPAAIAQEISAAPVSVSVPEAVAVVAVPEKSLPPVMEKNDVPQIREVVAPVAEIVVAEPVTEQPVTVQEAFQQNHGDACTCEFCSPPAPKSDIEQKFTENHDDACDCEFCKAKKGHAMVVNTDIGTVPAFG